MKLTRIGSLALLTTIALAACNDASGPSAEDLALNEAVAVVAADAAIEDVQQMFFALPAQSALGASYDAAAPPRNITRTVTFYDAGGVVMDAYNAETTAAINIMIEMSGEVARDGWTATVARSRDLTVSGLEGAETSRTWDGTGSGSVSGSRHTDEFGDRSYEMSSSVVIAAVVRGLPRETNPWPLSGTITRSVTITVTTADGVVTRERTAVLTFNGTQFVILVVNGEEYEVDLAALDAARGVRKRGA